MTIKHWCKYVIVVEIVFIVFIFRNLNNNENVCFVTATISIRRMVICMMLTAERSENMIL